MEIMIDLWLFKNLFPVEFIDDGKVFFMMACPPIDHVRLVRVVISLGRTDWELEASML